jgi:predicted ATPase
MEPLFLAAICGCNADLFRDVLQEVYIPRIQRGDAFYAAKILGVRGALLSVLVHFFAHGRWGSPVENGVEGQTLTAEDQLFILMQAGLYLTATRGYAAPDALPCYERAESLCVSLNRPMVLFSVLRGLWRYSLIGDKVSAAMQIAKRVYTLAQDQNDSALMIGAHRALAVTLYFSGDFEAARQHAMRGVQLWRLGNVHSPVEEVTAPAVTCLCYEAMLEWHLRGEMPSGRATIIEAISLAKELNDMHALAVALWNAGILAHYQRNRAEVDRLASELIEVCTRHNFSWWLVGGEILRGWMRSASGDTAEGLAWIEEGIENWRATGAILAVPYYLGIRAEVLYLADRAPEALESISEAEAVIERSEDRHWCAELHRLRGVFLTATGAKEAQIEASFCEAIRIAREQKSVSLQKRAEATYAEYCRQRANAVGGKGLRLSLS